MSTTTVRKPPLTCRGTECHQRSWPVVHTSAKTGVIYQFLAHSQKLVFDGLTHDPKSFRRPEMKSSPENRLARKRSWRLVFLPLLLIFSLSLLFTACSGVNAGTPSSQAGATTVQGKTALSPAPAMINFGTVQLNSKAVTSVLNLTNVGPSAETIESATIAPTPIFSLQGWTGPVTLKPGQTIQLRTTFAPKSAGNYSGRTYFGNGACNRG